MSAGPTTPGAEPRPERAPIEERLTAPCTVLYSTLSA